MAKKFILAGLKQVEVFEADDLRDARRIASCKFSSDKNNGNRFYMVDHYKKLKYRLK